jgi:hypothetical protein
VFVSDSAGNPVKDVSLSATAWATHYIKGGYDWIPDSPGIPASPGVPAIPGPLEPGLWLQDTAVICPNEDVLRKGLYEFAFDVNGNGRLEPGLPLGMTVNGKTDALGMATLSLRYPRDRANWIIAELTVTGTVAGTETMARRSGRLPGLAKDYADRKVSPPGETSPYGKMPGCTNTL